MRLGTSRLVLRSWRDEDSDAFAAMNADPVVMADLGGPLSRADSDAKLATFASFDENYGYTRWAIDGSLGDAAPEFLGYCGVRPHGAEHPLGPHSDIGWRLRRGAWGHGFATEAAQAALDDVFTRIGLTQVFAYTADDNTRSQAVMDRLGLERHPELDFNLDDDVLGSWRGLVWAASVRDA